jgi:hypothetical protein
MATPAQTRRPGMQPIAPVQRLYYTYRVCTGEADVVMNRSELIRRRRQMHRRIREVVAERRLAISQATRHDREPDTETAQKARG